AFTATSFTSSAVWLAVEDSTPPMLHSEVSLMVDAMVRRHSAAKSTHCAHETSPAHTLSQYGPSMESMRLRICSSSPSAASFAGPDGEDSPNVSAAASQENVEPLASLLVDTAL